MSLLVSRRGLIGAAGAAAGSVALSGCDKVAGSAPAEAFFRGAQSLTYRAQRLLGDGTALAAEFSPSQMSPVFRTNGNVLPRSAAWTAHAAAGFRDWRLKLYGLVDRPLDLPYPALLAAARRTQITRHDCVEGWSAIGQWSGPQLRTLLGAARVRPNARYVVFHCADDFGGHPYYESIDMIDAHHPQTILAVAMNGQPLPIGHGAPVRLRVERQLGYKQAKFIDAIEVTDDLSRLYGGGGGYWEDVAGYQWYAGI